MLAQAQGKVTTWRERLTCLGEPERLHPEVKSDTDSSTVMLQTSPDGLETDSLVIGTFISNSQVLPYGGLFINNYGLGRDGEPVVSKYLLLLKGYTERGALLGIQRIGPI